MASKQASSRLRKEIKAISEDPAPHIHVSVEESNILEWHYVLEGPKDADMHYKVESETSLGPDGSQGIAFASAFKLAK
ncbi:unnamed protein product [Effrenium voratum]|uniref:UBC core domain-containing protein n=1 Tax=Effrenium voratum TaxID=2562239 RepID=A0AA36IDX7_9DINO|nr:unnamed protein product [Effrenium voratum]